MVTSAMAFFTAEENERQIGVINLPAEIPMPCKRRWTDRCPAASRCRAYSRFFDVDSTNQRNRCMLTSCVLLTFSPSLATHHDLFSLSLSKLEGKVFSSPSSLPSFLLVLSTWSRDPEPPRLPPSLLSPSLQAAAVTVRSSAASAVGRRSTNRWHLGWQFKRKRLHKVPSRNKTCPWMKSSRNGH